MCFCNFYIVSTDVNINNFKKITFNIGCIQTFEKLALSCQFIMSFLLLEIYFYFSIPVCTISKYFHCIFFCQKLIPNWNIKFYHRMEIKDPRPFLRNMV